MLPFAGNVVPHAVQVNTPRAPETDVFGPRPHHLLKLLERVADPKKHREVDKKIGQSVDICNYVLIKANAHMIRDYEIRRHPDPKVHMALLKNESIWLTRFLQEVIGVSDLAMEAHRKQMMEFFAKIRHEHDSLTDKSTGSYEEELKKRLEILREKLQPAITAFCGMLAHQELDLQKMRMTVLLSRLNTKLLRAWLVQREEWERNNIKIPIDVQGIVETSLDEFLKGYTEDNEALESVTTKNE